MIAAFALDGDHDAGARARRASGAGRWDGHGRRRRGLGRCPAAAAAPRARDDQRPGAGAGPHGHHRRRRVVRVRPGCRAGRYVARRGQGRLRRRCRQRRCAPGPPRRGVAVADGETQRVTLRLPRGAVITGVVLDVDGQPAAGIAVSALARRYIGTPGERRYLSGRARRVSPSDDRGVYRIYGLPAGEYVVAAQPQTPAVGFPGAEVRTMSRGVVSDKGVILSQVFHPGAHRARPRDAGDGSRRRGAQRHRHPAPVRAARDGQRHRLGRVRLESRGADDGSRGRSARVRAGPLARTPTRMAGSPSTACRPGDTGCSRAARRRRPSRRRARR